MNTRALVRSALAIALVASAHACSNSIEQRDSLAHFLTDCSGACRAGLECVCGICTRVCSASSACANLGARAECTAAPAAGCSSETGNICDVACLTSDVCGTLGAGYECVAGRCRRGASTPARAAAGSNGEGPGPGPSLPAVDVRAACATPNGHPVPYTTAKELEAGIVGDWLECDAHGASPSQWGGGVRILTDHTWYSLVQNAACGYEPLSSGVSGYGTWSTMEWGSGTDQHAGFYLADAIGTAVFLPVFSDTGQLLLDAGVPRGTLFVRMPGAADVTHGAACGLPEPSAGTSSAGTSDAGTSDAGTSDAGTSDAETSDARTSEAGTSDARTPGGQDDSSGS